MFAIRAWVGLPGRRSDQHPAREVPCAYGVKILMWHVCRRVIILYAAAAFHAALAQPATKLDLRHYKLVFDEEFSHLDVSAWGPGTRWIAHTPWAGDFGDAQFVDPQKDFPFSVANGELRIEARKGDDGKWQSGLLASVDANGNGFSLQYGYFEMRAELPAGR
jgi:hypothetical protein